MRSHCCRSAAGLVALTSLTFDPIVRNSRACIFAIVLLGMDPTCSARSSSVSLTSPRPGSPNWAVFEDDGVDGHNLRAIKLGIQRIAGERTNRRSVAGERDEGRQHDQQPAQHGVSGESAAGESA